MENKADFFEKIKTNIEHKSFHINVVSGRQDPRYAYTIGNLNKFNSEFILAGCNCFLYDDLILIFNAFIDKLEKGFNWKNTNINIPKYGNFKLIKVNESWSKLMMLGVYDYFNIETFNSYQIIPETKYLTLDTPNMGEVWNPDTNLTWKWLDDKSEWNLNIPYESNVITDLDVLFGVKVLEVMRWENNEWEAFSKNLEEIDKNNIRVVPISTLLGIDSSTKAILDLEIGKGIWRSSDDFLWQKWN